jgi:hypothetical protein
LTLLDENMPHARQMIRFGIALRQVGFEWGRKGMSDEEILAALRRQRRTTFLTCDQGLYRRENCHPTYCVALLAVPPADVVDYARRFLRHPRFRKFASRQGKVVRVQPTGITCWERNAPRELETAWS